MLVSIFIFLIFNNRFFEDFEDFECRVCNSKESEKGLTGYIGDEGEDGNEQIGLAGEKGKKGKDCDANSANLACITEGISGKMGNIGPTGPTGVKYDKYTLLKEGHECKSSKGEIDFGKKDSVEECATACMNKQECKYFIYGIDNKKGRCYMENVKKDDCSDGKGFEKDSYNFYKINRDNPKFKGTNINEAVFTRYADKICYNKKPNLYKKIANENGKGFCIGTVWYGSHTRDKDLSKWKSKESNGSISCSNQQFGDPLRGVKKQCYCNSYEDSCIFLDDLKKIKSLPQ